MDSILTTEYATYKPFQKKKFLDSVSLLLPNLKNDSLKINYLFEIAAGYYFLKDSKSSLNASKQIYGLALENNDSISLGRSLYYIGDCYESYRKDSAYYYYKESEKIFRILQNQEKIAKALFNKAYLLFKEGNYTESEIEVTKALQELQNSKNYDLLYQCYYLQCCNHTELEEYDYALKYLSLAQNSLAQNIELTGSSDEAEYNDLLNTTALCNIYDKKGEYKKSIALLSRVLTPKLKSRQPTSYAFAMGNLAYSNMQEGNLKESKKQFVEAIAMSKKMNNVEGYLFKIINFGAFYLKVGDTTTAIRYFNEALPLAKRLKMGTEVLKTLELLASSEKEKASFYQQSYVTISDSLSKHQRLNREKFSRIEYETNKVENSNRILSTNNLLLILGLVLTVLLFIILLLVRNQNARKKELKLVEQRTAANDELFSIIKDFQVGIVKAKEEEQSRISKELHDGVVNNIYAIRMVLEMLNEKEDTFSKEQRISYLKELNKVESEIRTISHDLSAAEHIDRPDFSFILNSLVKSTNIYSSTNFTVSKLIAIDWDSYSSIVKVNLYRILQELFLNIIKHAQAKNCEVTISLEQERLKIIVSDDGIGYDVNEIKGGIGHKNIKERLELIKAEYTFISERNVGSKLIILL